MIGGSPVRRRIVQGTLLSASALAIYGFIRFVFNTIGIRVFGPLYIGELNTVLAVTSIVGAFLGSPFAALGAKFIGEFLGDGDEDSAEHLFSRLSLIVIVLSFLASLVCAAAFRTSSYWSLGLYAGLYGSYSFFKSTYFAFGENRTYFRLELLASAAFFVLFGIACWQRSTGLATWSWLAQPLAFTVFAIAGNRRRFRWGHSLPRYGRGEYTTYLLSSVANVVTSLAPFHVIILLAQWALSDAAAVGYLSALLSTVIPLRFLPAALGPVLLPEMARRYGARDAAGQRRLVAASIRALVAVTLVFAVPMPVVAPILLQVLGIPDTGEFRLLVSLLFLSELLSLGGTPLGHFLNATEHVTRHAVISVVATVAGIFIGSLAFTSLGLIGGGVMRISSDLFLVGGRLVITHRALGIMRDLRRELAAVGLGVAAMVGATLLSWPATGLICLLGLVIAELTMLPGLAAGVRAAPGAARDSE